MEQSILTSDQLVALACLKANPLSSAFYLAGGTALSEYYFHHRFSDDLDFFTEEKEFPQLEVEVLAREIKENIGAISIEYRRLHDRRMFFFQKGDQELKVEFSYYPFPPIETRQMHDGIAVDSLPDIAAGKLMALLDRVEAKDFVDLYFTAEEGHISFERLMSLVKQKFDFVIDPLMLGSEFAKVRAVRELPRMIKPLTVEELKAFFAARAKELGPQVLQE